MAEHVANQIATTTMPVVPRMIAGLCWKVELERKTPRRAAAKRSVPPDVDLELSRVRSILPSMPFRLETYLPNALERTLPMTRVGSHPYLSILEVDPT